MKTIECKEFYNLMQNYQHSKTDPVIIISYEAVIDYIDAKLNARQDQTFVRLRAQLEQEWCELQKLKAQPFTVTEIVIMNENFVHSHQPKETE